ncbi:MAG: hypothetical protein SH819_02925 [Cytophagales bacterium]|nr:hypothetical protein [Cytophagales bacterium]
MTSNIVHQYFKKAHEELIILVQVNPIHLKGTELTVAPRGSVSRRELEFDAAIFEDLRMDGFTETSPLEFHLYLSGLAGEV